VEIALSERGAAGVGGKVHVLFLWKAREATEASTRARGRGLKSRRSRGRSEYRSETRLFVPKRVCLEN
jgi:hypothetical protein